MALRKKARGLSAEDLGRLIAERAAARVAEKALADGLAETAFLARERGETVSEASGRMRVTSRDGLRTLYEQGGLQQPEYDAGALYRRYFETLNAGPRSSMNRDASGVRGFNEAGAEGFAELRAFRAEKLRQWEALAKTGRELWVLRLVAGQGRTINSIAPGGSARHANTQALMAVLRAIAVERAERSQIWLVTHSERLADEVCALGGGNPRVVLKTDGATTIAGLKTWGEFREDEDLDDDE